MCNLAEEGDGDDGRLRPGLILISDEAVTQRMIPSGFFSFFLLMHFSVFLFRCCGSIGKERVDQSHSMQYCVIYTAGNFCQPLF